MLAILGQKHVVLFFFLSPNEHATKFVKVRLLVLAWRLARGGGGRRVPNKQMVSFAVYRGSVPRQCCAGVVQAIAHQLCEVCFGVPPVIAMLDWPGFDRKIGGC